MSLTVGMKEGTDCREHRLLYTNNESGNTTWNTDGSPYGNSHNAIQKKASDMHGG